MLFYWLRPWAITPKEQKEGNVTDFFSFEVAGFLFFAAVAFFIAHQLFGRWNETENEESTIADVSSIMAVLSLIFAVVSCSGVVVSRLMTLFG